jgi:hypothetical protein
MAATSTATVMFPQVTPEELAASRLNPEATRKCIALRMREEILAHTNMRKKRCRAAAVTKLVLVLFVLHGENGLLHGDTILFPGALRMRVSSRGTVWVKRNRLFNLFSDPLEAWQVPRTDASTHTHVEP